MEENKNIEPEQPPENIAETEQSKIPSSSGKIIPSQEKILPEAEVAASEQEQITNLQSQTEEMEVHKHPHHVTHKKKWGEYSLEFLMLFLAVFLGFVAENIRENYVEHHREKQFIRSLMNDIKADTARIKNIISQRITRERRLDSLTFLLNSDSNAVHMNILYFYAVTASRSGPFRFIPTDGTMQQLKNSGAFRLIRNREVADSIGRYDVSVRSLQRQGELEETFLQDYRATSATIFNALVFDRILDTNINAQMPTENPALLPFDKRELYAWNYKMYLIKTINKGNRRDARLLLQQVENLLETLKKEYHLK